MKNTTIIIGGGAGGMTSATHLKKLAPETRVIVIEKSPYVSWAGCPTPYYISGELPKKSVVHYPKEYFIDNRDIEVYTNHIVDKIDFENYKLSVSGDELDGDIEYNNLILSLGGNPIVPPIKNYSKEINGIFTLSHATDAFAIKNYFNKHNIKSCSIIGGGFIGLEMAETFSKLGAKVNIIEKADDILPDYNSRLKSNIFKTFKEKDIDFFNNCVVEKIDSNGGKISSITLSNGDEINTDLLLISIGKRPNIELLEKSNYKFTNEKKMVIPNEQMRILENVYAIGDMILTNNILTNKPVYVPFGDVADKQGLIAAKNIASREAKFKGVVGASTTSFFNLKLAKTGLNSTQALENGYNPKEVYVKGYTKIPGFKTKGNDCLVVYDKDSLTVLGAFMVGDEAVAQFIDQFSIVISRKIPISEFIDLDFAYSPTNSTVWNPLLATYRKAIK